MKKAFLLLFLFSCSISNGQWFEQQTPPVQFNLFSCSFPSLSTGFAVGYGGRMIKTTNGGQNWFNISFFTSTGENLESVFFTDENTGWMCSSSDTLYKTTNSGVTWIPWKTLLSPGFRMQFVNSATGWIAAQPYLYRTTDHGDTWNIVYSNIWYHFTFLDANTGWQATYSGGSSTIQKTTNGGLNWTSQHSTSNFRIVYSLKFIDQNTGWAVGYREIILKTTNGGQNWTQQRDMDNSHSLVSVDFVNENTGWVASNDGFALYTINGGSNWASIPLPSGGGNVKFLNSHTGWIVGGKVFKTTTGGFTPRTISLKMLPEGMYNENTNSMVPDTASVCLRKSTAPYSITDSARGLVNSSGTASLSFLDALNGENYYIVVKTRNALETWSATPNAFVNNSLNYDFTTNSSMAFGNNMKLKGSKWTIYSGDVNNDGFIDLTDISDIYNDATNFKTGYLNTDLNGDNIVTLTDILICYNNSVEFVGIIRP